MELIVQNFKPNVKSLKTLGKIQQRWKKSVQKPQANKIQ